MPKRRSSRRSPRAGSALIYTTIVLTGLLAIISFAVDYGRVVVAKAELQDAADGAAKYAATGLINSTYVSKGRRAAKADDSDDPRIPTSNIVAGNWSTALGFTPNGSPTNAVSVTAS